MSPFVKNVEKQKFFSKTLDKNVCKLGTTLDSYSLCNTRLFTFILERAMGEEELLKRQK